MSEFCRQSILLDPINESAVDSYHAERECVNE